VEDLGSVAKMGDDDGSVDFEPVQWEKTMSGPHDFDLEEFKALRQEILQKVDAISKLEVLAIGGAATVYAWLATRALSNPVVWFIPAMFPILGGMRCFFVGRQIRMAGDYVQSLEKRLRPECLPDLGVHGWEGYIRLPHVHEKFIDRISPIFWWVFVAITILLPLIFQPR
jgi:hypothetical protein